MKSIKKILIEHGEKILLLLVVLFCGASILRMVMRDPETLDLPGGKERTIRQQDIKRNLDKAQRHLVSNVKVMPSQEADKVSRELALRILSGKPTKSGVDYEWLSYVQPPPIGVPPIFKPIPLIPPINIPSEFRTRFGNPVNFQAITSLNKVLLVCKDSKLLNYPKEGSRRMLLWRKAVGSGKDKLHAAHRRELLRSPRDVNLAEVELAAAESEVKELSLVDADGVGASSRKSSSVSSELGAGWFADTKASTMVKDDSSDSDYSREMYLEARQVKELQAFEDMKIACSPTSVVATGWELVAVEMYPVKGELTGEVLTSLLVEGYDPDVIMLPEEMEKGLRDESAKEEKAEKKRKEPAKPKSAAKDMEWGEIIQPPIVRKKAVKKEEEVVEEIEPQYYVFIDDTVSENMVYRYAVVATVSPQAPPEEITANEKYEGWDIYCEIAGIDGPPVTGGNFAPPARQVQPFIKSVMSKEYKGVSGPTLLKLMIPCYPKEQAGLSDEKVEVVTDAKNPPVRGQVLRDEKGRLTKLGWAYRHNEPCYSDFVYSDLLLTPKKYEFELRGAFAASGNSPATTTIRVHKVQKDGMLVSNTFSIEPKPLKESLKWHDFLVKEDDGKPVWPPKQLPLSEVYAKLGDIKPVVIGKDLGKKKGDFTTGWGVVEVRPYTVQGVVKKLKGEEGEEEWVQIGTIPAHTEYAVIIAEVKPAEGQPRRFRRIHRQPKQPKDPKRRYEYEFFWEPEIKQKIEQRRKQQAKKKSSAATK